MNRCAINDHIDSFCHIPVRLHLLLSCGTIFFIYKLASDMVRSDLVTLSLQAITWRDLDASMKIRWSRLNHKDSPFRIPSRPLLSSMRRSDSHAQFQNVINLSSTRNLFLDVSTYQTFTQSLNILISSSYKLIYASRKCMKSRFQ